MLAMKIQVKNMFELKGFTLLELLFSLLMLAILINIGIPSFQRFIVSTRVETEILKLDNLLVIARQHAINHENFVTLCPLNVTNQCHQQWQQKLTVFTDANNNRIYEPELAEVIIAEKQAIVKGDVLQYGKSRVGLTFNRQGALSAWGQNATFSYCPKGYPDKNQGIIVATTGRSYNSLIDKNHQQHKNRWGKKIACD